MLQKINQVSRSRRKSADPTQPFTQRSHHDVDFAVKTKMFWCAASMGPHNAGPVGVIDHDERFVALSQCVDVPQIRNIAVHTIDSVDNDDQVPAAF